VPNGAPWKRSKKVKVDVERTLEMLTPCGSSLSTADFDRSEWEIMYLLFVAEGLIDPSEHVNRGSTLHFIITIQLLCVLSCICVYFILPLAFFSCIYVPPAFEPVLCPPSV
jgi:hypothetical protein